MSQTVLPVLIRRSGHENDRQLGRLHFVVQSVDATNGNAKDNGILIHNAGMDRLPVDVLELDEVHLRLAWEHHDGIAVLNVPLPNTPIWPHGVALRSKGRMSPACLSARRSDGPSSLWRRSLRDCALQKKVKARTSPGLFNFAGGA